MDRHRRRLIMSDNPVETPAPDTGETMLSLAMIVRDAAGTLEACLMSIRPWVDEMVVVDTGSLDETPQIAARLGARVFHFTWCDDFSAARNESLRHVRGSWVFWMDADDTIDALNGRKLRRLVESAHDPATTGYVMQVHCPSGDSPDDYTAVDHVKVLRNRPDLRFEGRIHEQILPAIRRAGGEVAWTEIFVVHSGSDHSPEGMRRKHERDLRILMRDLEERPEHPFVLFNLGMTYADMGRHEEAAGWLKRSIAAALPTESHLRKAYALLAASLQQLDHYAEAEAVSRQGLSLFPDDSELLFRQAMLAHAAGRLDEAAELYRQVLAGRPSRYFASIDRGIAGAKARHNLACVYVDMNLPELAEIQWRRILEEEPRSLRSRRMLIETLLRKGRFATAGVELARIEKEDGDGWVPLLLRSQLLEARGELAQAKSQMLAAAERHPDEPQVLDALGRFLFEHGKASEAAEAISRLVRLQPDNGAALHNLGVAQLRAGQATASVETLRASLRFRPASSETEHQLSQAIRLRDGDSIDPAGKPALSGVVANKALEESANR
jgi:O-antigen biosynthesis protein